MRLLGGILIADSPKNADEFLTSYTGSLRGRDPPFGGNAYRASARR